MKRKHPPVEEIFYNECAGFKCGLNKLPFSASDWIRKGTSHFKILTSAFI